VASDSASDGDFRFERDGRGEEIRRERPAVGDAIETTRDALGRPAQIVVRGRDGRPLVTRGYRWAPGGVLGAIEDDRRGTTELEVDVAGRPLSRVGPDGEERYRYSLHGTPLPEGRETTVGPGGRIEADGE